MGAAARSLRSRRARRLVMRFTLAGGALVLGSGAGWVFGYSVTGTVALLCIGLPVMALIHHFALSRNQRHHRNGWMLWPSFRRPKVNLPSAARKR